MKILIATLNQTKIKRYQFLLAGSDYEFLTTTDLGLDSIEVSEGDDIEENARQKALAYRALTDLPIIANDAAFEVTGMDHEPAQVKRIALAGQDEFKMSQAEIAAAVVEYYQRFITERGGEVPAVWRDCYALLRPDGSLSTIMATRHVTLHAQVREPLDIYMPIRSMYTSDITSKYPADQTETETRQELAPLTRALLELL